MRGAGVVPRSGRLRLAIEGNGETARDAARGSYAIVHSQWPIGLVATAPSPLIRPAGTFSPRRRVSYER